MEFLKTDQQSSRAPRDHIRGGPVPGGHVPVMLHEVLHAAGLSGASEPLRGAIVLDGTFGAGGYSRGFLDAGAGLLIALDQDPAAVAVAQNRFAGEPGFKIVHANFADIQAVLDRLHKTDARIYNGGLDVIVLDLGVSSMQLDQAERGFSFQKDGPLDMRMDTSKGQTAAEVINTIDGTALADLIWRYGEERASRRIAAAIVKRRAVAPFLRTPDLAEVVRTALGGEKAQYRKGKKRLDPATKTFQAIRIFVNDELAVINRVLEQSVTALAPGGRLVVVTFHSLEDRIVKQFFRRTSGNSAGTTRHRPQGDTPEPLFRLTTRKAILAGDAEIARNPRSRSAKMRFGIRTAFRPPAAGAPFAPKGEAAF